MAMVCPQCDGIFEQRLSCPQCGVRLLYEDTRRKRFFALNGSGESWEHTPWGRLFVGLLLAQGLYYVLRHLWTAGVLATHEYAPNDVWATLTGLIVLQGLQGISVLAAGLLIGAGQRRGIFFGAVAGVWNGVLCILVQNLMGEPVLSLSLFGEPMIQAAVGAVGGLAGSLIWKPIPAVNLPAEARKSKPMVPVMPRTSSLVGPLAWGRILTGITLAVGGVVWVDVIREFILDASEGHLRIDTHLQAEIVTWEISALAMIAGGALAGATTKNGMKQGLAVGIGTGTILMGIRLASNHMPAEIHLLTLVSALGLGFFGGWFGGQLLPPVLALPRRKRKTIAMV
jgi:hypothetical protein